MCVSLQGTTRLPRATGETHSPLCNTRSTCGHVRNASRPAFSSRQMRKCSKLHVVSGMPTKTEDLRPGVETAEGLRQAMEPIGPVKDLGFPKDFEKHYKMGEEIGKGAWAAVYTAIELSTGEKRAVKVLEKWRNKDGTIENGFAVRIRREIATYQAMSGSLNVCHFHGAYECEKHLYLVTEMCTGGQLWERVEAGRFSEAQAARIIREILQLLAQAHSRNIIIRDIKPDNLLFLNHEEDAPLKAIDFGIATVCRPDETLEERCGSPVYVAPEVLKKCYGQKADVWSAGMVAYLLLCARLPWITEDSDKKITFSDLYVSMGDGKSFNRKDAFSALMFQDLDFESEPWPNLSADARDFVQQLLQKDPAHRITAIDALHHRWLIPEGTASAQPFDSSIVQRLQNFGTFSNTKKVALRAIVSSLAHDSGLVKEVREAFEELEHGHTGSVKNATLLQGLRDKGYTLQDNEAEQLVSHLDVDFSGDVDYLDWLAAMIDWHKVRQDGDWDDRVRQAFASLDNNQDGVICDEDLQSSTGSQAPPGASKASTGSRDALTSMDLDEFTDLVDPAEQRNLEMYNRRYKSQDED